MKPNSYRCDRSALTASVRCFTNCSRVRPQTNGMIERFNGRIEDVLQSHRFQSGEDLEQTLLRYVHLYNSQLPQLALKGRTPIRALKDWQRQRPELFRKRVYNHTGCDS
jgi:hypothetical protein